MLYSTYLPLFALCPLRLVHAIITYATETFGCRVIYIFNVYEYNSLYFANNIHILKGMEKMDGKRPGSARNASQSISSLHSTPRTLQERSGEISGAKSDVVENPEIGADVTQK